MQVREYPFPIDPPMSAAMRETLMYAGLVTRACRGVSRARDRRLRAAYAEATATEAPEASAFSEILGENGIKVGDFHQAVSSLVDDPVSAPTVKNLLGALTGKETAAADLGAQVQDMLTRRGAAPRVHASPPSRPAASTPRAPRPAQSSGFRWEFTSAARGGQARPSPDNATTPPLAADPPANDPPTASTAKPEVVNEAPRTGSVPPRTEPAPAGAADVENDAGETTLRPEPKISPPVQAEPTVPPVEGEVVPTEQGIIFALEALSERSDDLKKRVEALEVLVESQAERLAEADRRLEAALRRLEETVRKQAQNQARSDQEVAELRERIARVETRTSAIDMSAAEPRAAEGPANDAPRAEDTTASNAQVEPIAAEETPSPSVAPTASDEVARDNPATPVAQDASEAQRSDAVTAAAIHESPAEVPHDADKTLLSDEERVVKDTTSATAEQQMMQRIEGTMLAVEDRVSRAEDKAACTEEQIAKKNDFAEYIERHTKALERGELT